VLARTPRNVGMATANRTSDSVTKLTMIPANARPAPFWAPLDRRIWPRETKPKMIPSIDPMPKSVRIESTRLAMARPLVVGGGAQGFQG
jgi:hypothetical protein